jgi:hypothetical protein
MCGCVGCRVTVAPRAADMRYYHKRLQRHYLQMIRANIQNLKGESSLSAVQPLEKY